MKKYLVAFASVLAFSAPAMASEQAIEFMSDAQLGQHSGAKLAFYEDDGNPYNGGDLNPTTASELWELIRKYGGGKVVIDGEQHIFRDQGGNLINVRVAALRTKLAVLASHRFRTHLVTVDENQNYSIKTK